MKITLSPNEIIIKMVDTCCAVAMKTVLLPGSVLITTEIPSFYLSEGPFTPANLRES